MAVRELPKPGRLPHWQLSPTPFQEVLLNLRDDPHTCTNTSDVCAHCGQPLPDRVVPYYGDRRTNRTGLVVTVLLHLLLVALYFYQPERPEKKARPPDGGEVVYVAPLAKPAQPPPQKSATRTPTKPNTPRTAPARPRVERLPDTITIPDEKPVEVAKEEPKPEAKREEIPPEMDMAEYIAKRRAARGATDPSTSTEESESARGTRNALANIAAINKRGQDDANESGGVFSISNKTFHSMDLKFRGWNPNFKRRWLTSVTVEQGNEPDVETAVVKKMIELIRREKTGDFEWDSHRLGKVITMSARPRDTAELQAFLMKEMFPEYRPPAR
jgi:outer membrane biosynthesis protein TonB